MRRRERSAITGMIEGSQAKIFQLRHAQSCRSVPKATWIPPDALGHESREGPGRQLKVPTVQLCSRRDDEVNFGRALSQVGGHGTKTHATKVGFDVDRSRIGSRHGSTIDASIGRNHGPTSPRQSSTNKKLATWQPRQRSRRLHPRRHSQLTPTHCIRLVIGCGYRCARSGGM